jgi:hypothetical protein
MPPTNTTTNDMIPPIDLALNYFTLGGDKSPGKCEIRGACREWEWLELGGWGLDGASLILRRRILVEFEIDITIATQADLDIWDDFEGKWLKNPIVRSGSRASTARQKIANAQAAIAALNTQSQALGGLLSDAQQAQISATAAQFAAVATTASANASQPSRGIGIYHPRLARLGIGSVVVVKLGQFVQTRTGGEMITVKFKEYRAPKFVLTKPEGSIPGTTAPTPKSKDTLDDAIAAETQKNVQLTAADNNLGALF